MIQDPEVGPERSDADVMEFDVEAMVTYSWGAEITCQRGSSSLGFMGMGIGS